MTKKITKPIKNILKPVTGILKPKIPQPQQPQQPIIEAPRGDRNEPTTATTADIKPNDPRLNMSPDQILANRKRRTRPPLGRTRDTSLLYNSNLTGTIG